MSDEDRERQTFHICDFFANFAELNFEHRTSELNYATFLCRDPRDVGATGAGEVAPDTSGIFSGHPDAGRQSGSGS
jgi:hypothetical protein